MADNAYKRAIVNRALAILNAGRTADASLFFTSITDAEFADWSTIAAGDNPDKRLAVMLYEPILKQVLEDIQPEWAMEYADLGQYRKVNHADGGWDYLFELPDDFLALVYQCEESNPLVKPTMDRDPELLFFKGYSHVVVGSDDQAYVCSADHTSATSTKPVSGADWATKWTLYSTDGSLGATWAASVAYKVNRTAFMLASNTLTNEDGDSAYIRYLAYVQTTSGGTAGRSDQPQYYPESFKNALATRLAAEMALDSKDYERRVRLLTEYEQVAKPGAWAAQNTHKGRTKQTTVFEARTA